MHWDIVARCRQTHHLTHGFTKSSKMIRCEEPSKTSVRSTLGLLVTRFHRESTPGAWDSRSPRGRDKDLSQLAKYANELIKNSAPQFGVPLLARVSIRWNMMVSMTQHSPLTVLWCSNHRIILCFFQFAFILLLYSFQPFQQPTLPTLLQEPT